MGEALKDSRGAVTPPASSGPARHRRHRGPTALLAVLSLAALLSAISAGGRISAQTPAITQSPEQAIIQLLPFQLTQADLPAGFTLDTDAAVSTTSSFAFFDPHPLQDFVTENKAHLVVAVDQLISSVPNTNGLLSADVHETLFMDAASTRGYVSGQVYALTDPLGGNYDTAESVDLGTTIGEASQAWHVTFPLPDDSAARGGGYVVRWLRGSIAFSVGTEAPLGTERLQEARALATAADRKFAAMPPPTFDGPAVKPPATEEQRLNALLRLKQAFDGISSPAGHGEVSPSIEIPAGRVFAGADPAGMLHRIDEVWKRVASYVQDFPDQSDSDHGLSVAVALDLDAASALADIHDFLPPAGGTPAGFDPAGADPTWTLGDARVGNLVVGSNPDGSSYQLVDVTWTHGPLLFELALTTAADSTVANVLDTLLPVARQLEAHYQASGFAAGQ